MYLFMEDLLHSRVCKAQAGRIRPDTSILSIVWPPGFAKAISRSLVRMMLRGSMPSSGRQVRHVKSLIMIDGYIGWTTIMRFKLHLCLDELYGFHFCAGNLFSGPSWAQIDHALSTVPSSVTPPVLADRLSSTLQTHVSEFRMLWKA